MLLLLLFFVELLFYVFLFGFGSGHYVLQRSNTLFLALRMR